VVSRSERLHLIFEVRCRHDAAVRLLDDALTEQRLDARLSTWGARALLERSRSLLDLLANEEPCR
jgi:hypothetical protein